MLHLSELPEHVDTYGHHFPNGLIGPNRAQTFPIDVCARRAERPSEPHNLEAEQALLGAILFDNGAYGRVSAFLLSEHFFDPVHGSIYEAAGVLIGSGKRADAITMRTCFGPDEMASRDLTVHKYLGWLTANASTTIGAPDYGRVVYEEYAKRAVADFGRELTDAACGHLPDAFDLLARAYAEAAHLNETYSDPSADRVLEYATDMRVDTAPPDLVEGVVAANAVAAMYGPSGGGKTFLAIHMASCIALGRPFLGRSVLRGAVLYVALEGQAGVVKRFCAEMQRFGDLGRAVGLLRAAGTLAATQDGISFTSKVISLARRQAKDAGFPVLLVVIDTLACGLAGEDENSASSMSGLLTNCKRINMETGATVLLVAHPGKDRDRGMRGSSALFAGCDSVVEIEREEGTSTRNVIVRKHGMVRQARSHHSGWRG